jgi:polysaccharide export outer membrane protein
VADTIIFSRGKFFPLVTLLFSLSGCIGEIPRTDLPEAPKGVTPELKMAPKLPPYRLQVGDVVDVKLMLNPELNDQVVVRPDGMISTTVVGDIPAYGRTVRQIQKDLESGYGKNLTQPRVSLIVRSFAPTRVYVIGEVNAPGEFVSVGPTLTLLQAIARAGGVKNSAETSNIIIVRHGAGDATEAYRASYHAAVTGEDPASDVRLAPYDVVYVPRTGVANVYLNYQQDIQQFLPISGGVNAVYEINSSRIR